MQGNGGITRRTFLKGAAASACAFPRMVSASALGAGGAGAPNDRITMGFIGVGKMGMGQLGGFAGRGEVQILAACDVEEEKRLVAKKIVEDRYAGRSDRGPYRGCATYLDFRELLARDDIDAVLIATPDHWHAIQAIEAARAGKDIYCQKPLSLTIREARAMVRAVRRYGVVFQTGSQQRSDDKFRFGCEMVRSGRIGKVLTVHVSVGGPSQECFLPGQPTPEGLDWDLWLGPAPWRPFHEIVCPRRSFGGWPRWRNYRDYSGGGMTDWGAHHFDIAQWGLGMDESGPVEIHPPDGKEFETLTYRYANGVIMYHGRAKGVAANGVLFTGTKGKVEVNRGHLRTWPASLAQKPTGADEVHLYRSRNHEGDWLACIRTRERPICDVEIGCRSVTVCHLGNLAYWLERPIRWDPAKEEIIGDREASRWLDRPKRAPWTL